MSDNHYDGGNLWTSGKVMDLRKVCLFIPCTFDLSDIVQHNPS